ncbi:N-acetyltransferase [Microbulbifer sp. CnH-101-G]|uniref:N-acetyltransferase n=1 Tax=Microbulbifer sp. CnH-101-G TaxID=3243393 RepID=UPI00403A4062
MIRSYTPNDIETILNIWLKASVKAHNFIAADFWKSQIDNMRNIYIPNSETYIYEIQSKVTGFYSLVDNTLAALFVDPEFQGQGIGKQLLEHAKSQRSPLNLTVYKENVSSYQFYLSQGFHLLKEQSDNHTGHIECLMSTNIKNTHPSP